MVWLEWISVVADGITIGGALQKMRQWSVKHPVVMALAATGVVILLIGGALGALFSEPENTSFSVELPPLVTAPPEEQQFKYSRLTPACRQPRGGNSSLYLPSRQKTC